MSIVKNLATSSRLLELEKRLTIFVIGILPTPKNACSQFLSTLGWGSQRRATRARLPKR